MEVIDEEEDDGSADILAFIELKYCTVCHIEIPLRAKHCKQCDQCVATHDHHCPWVGTCVGERNRVLFYGFLWSQLSQTLLGFLSCVLILTKIISEGKELLLQGAGIAVLGLVCFLISVSLSVLIGLHTYLISKAMTSWEYFSWMRITYLKVWPRRYGSPFSKGSASKNFLWYFTSRRSGAFAY